MKITRRNFLGISATGAAAVATGSWQDTVSAQETGINYTQKLSKYPVKDQYGKNFNWDTLKNKPYILAFGYNGCQYCDIIGNNLGKIRESLQGDDTLKDVPIVVVNIHPTEDLKDAKGYVANYHEIGVFQRSSDGNVYPDSISERRTLGEEAFEEMKSRPASERVLHILFPANEDMDRQMQRDVRARYIPSDKNSHGLRIAVVDKNGECRFAEDGTVEKLAEKTALVDDVKKTLTDIVRNRPQGRTP